jgi:hypothetical protein
MESFKSLREDIQKPDEMIVDTEIWRKASHELREMAKTIVNHHARFAWLVVEAWCNKHGQVLIDKNHHSKV